MTWAPGFRERLEAAIRAYDDRARSAGLVHGEVNEDRARFRLAWVGLEVDYEQLHIVAGEYAAIATDDIVAGVAPDNVLAGLWAHGFIVAMLMQMRRMEGADNGRPVDGQGSGS